MTKIRYILTTLIVLLTTALMPVTAVAGAHDLKISITRKNNPLPPNAGELKDNFGRYFDVRVTNTTSNIAQIRLALNLQGPLDTYAEPAQIPSCDNYLMVMDYGRAQINPIIVLNNQTNILSEFELTTHFRQYESTVMKTAGLLTSVTETAIDGNYGLLPEGHYGLQLLAFDHSVPGNDKVGEGVVYFDIAYHAKAPKFILPTPDFTSNEVDKVVIKNSQMNLPYLRFAWNPSVLNMAKFASTGRQFLYDMQIISIPKGAPIEEASGVQFEQLSLVSPFCDVPIQEIRALRDMDNGEGYAVRVRARSAFASTRNMYYTLVDNDGYSNWMRIVWAGGDDDVDEGEDDTVDIGDPGCNVEVLSTEEIPITIKCKSEELPIEIETYFAQPSALFDITFDNSKGEARDVSMLLQYYKAGDDWGLMVKPSKQHYDHTMHVEAGEQRPLTAEEIDYLMGGYEMSEVIEFMAESGILRGVTTLKEFDRSPLHVCCRMALPEGKKSIVNCKVLGRAKDMFTITNKIPEKALTVSIERKLTGAYPAEVERYMQHPEELFDFSVKNNAMTSINAVMQISIVNRNSGVKLYGYDAKSRYIDRMSKSTFRLAASANKKLTDDEVNSWCGNFPNFFDQVANKYAPNKEGELDGSYYLVAEVFDADAAAGKLKYDDTYGVYTVPSEALLGSDTCSFCTDEFGLVLFWNEPDGARPQTTLDFFDVPGKTMSLTLTNNSGKDVKVMPVFTLFGPGEEPLYTIKGKAAELNERGKSSPLPMKEDEMVTLDKEAMNKLLGTLTNVTVTGKNAGDYDPDKYKLSNNIHRIHVDLYDASDYDGILDITSRDVIASDELECYISNLVTELTVKQNPLPVDPNAFFTKPSDYFALSLTNMSDEEMVVYPRFTLQRADSVLCWRGNDYAKRWDDAHYITLPGNETVKLTNEQINLLWGDFAKVTCVDAVSPGSTETTSTDINVSDVKLPIAGYKAIVDVWSKTDLPEKSDTFVGHDTTAVRISNAGTIKILVEPRPEWKDKMPAETIEYFKNPGEYFDIKLVNRGVQDQTIGLDLVYSDTLVASSINVDTSRRQLLVPGRGDKEIPDTLALTKDQINLLAGEWALTDVRRLNLETHELDTPESVEIGTGTRRLRAVAFSRTVNGDTLGVDTTRFHIGLGEVIIDNFVLHLTSSERITKGAGKDGYKGEGYIAYKPLGFEINMAVEFDSIWINDENVVTRGYVQTKRKKDDANYIPYEWFDEKVMDGSGIKTAEYKDKVQKLAQDNGFGEYYNWVNDGCKYVNDIVGLIAGDPVTLPLGIDGKDALLKDCPVSLQMISCAWTPDSSWVNLMAEYKMEGVPAVSAKDASKNNVLALAAPFLRIHHDDTFLLPESGMMALISDVTFTDSKTGFQLTCKAPSNFKCLDDLRSAVDGCLITWTNSKFDSLLIDASVVIPELMRSDEEGHLLDESGNKVDDLDKAAKPSIELIAGIKQTGDWWGQIKMESFQVPDAEGFTFTPTGTKVGILYDHSATYTHKNVNFHKEYDFANEKIEGRWTDKNKSPWMGFYWEKLAVRFPDWMPTVGKDEGNIVVEMTDMMCDASGFTSSFNARELIDASMDGWKITLDTIRLDIVQNDFNKFGFNGKMNVPFLDGDIKYSASVTRQNKGEDVGTWRMQFKTVADTLSIGFLPVVDLKFTNTYFDVDYTIYGDPKLHNGEEDKLDIKLVLNGRLGLESDEKASFKLPDIHFYNMYISNHVESFKPEYAKGSIWKWDGPTWHNGETEKDATIAMSMGNWSLASQSKSIGPFTFTLDSYSTDGSSFSSEGVKASLGVAGKIELMEGTAGLGASLSLDFDLNWKTWKAEWKGVHFKEIEGTAEFAGCELYAKLTVIDENTNLSDINLVADAEVKGYKAEAKLTLPGKFLVLEMNGGYFKATEITEEYLHAARGEIKQDYMAKDTITYSAGYLKALVGSKAGINLGVVKLTKIEGGFYINCSEKADGNIALKKGMYGGMLGLGLADPAGTFLNGDFQLFFFYDSRAKTKEITNARGAIERYEYEGQLSQIRLIGNLHAITKDATSEGLINSKAMILYDRNDKEHFLEISITVTASAENVLADGGDFQKMMNELSEKAKDYDIEAAIKESTGINVEEQGAIKDEDPGKSAKSDCGEPNKSLADSSTGKNEGKKEGKEGPHCNPPSATITMEFRIDFVDTKSGKNKWYLHIGTPDERCTFTFIDFAFGNSTVGAGAYLGGNGYICLGNSLPDIPELPTKVYEFLYGTKKTAGESNGVTKTTSDDDRETQFLNTSESNGGIMIGAEVFGKFWCNALICYAEVEFDAGFDVALAHFKNKVCAQTMKAPGKNGWYAQGQLYAYLAGELGVMMKFLGKTHKFSLVELAIGGVLKMGLPNPTWFLGKFKAQGSMLGGLIKFNRTVDVKAGNVCTPLSASPLDEIDIFADCNPGTEEKDQGLDKDNAVSAYSMITYTTNMVLGQPYPLYDDNRAEREDGQTMRTFKFEQEQAVVQRRAMTCNCKGVCTNTNHWITVGTKSAQVDDVTYNLWSDTEGHFDFEKEYRILLIGRAYEKEKTGNYYVNPYFVALVDSVYNTSSGTSTDVVRKNVKMGKEYQAVWRDTLCYYFRTGTKSYALGDNFMVAYPMTDNEYIYENEARHPYVSLRDGIISHYNVGNKYVKLRLGKPKLTLSAYEDVVEDAYKNFESVATDNIWLNLLLLMGSVMDVQETRGLNWNFKNIEPVYEYKVREQITSNYVLWKPDVLLKGSSTASLPLYGEATWKGADGNEYSGKTRQPYVMQYVLVDPGKQNTARTDVDTLRSSAFAVADAYDQDAMSQFINENSGTDANSTRTDRTVNSRSSNSSSSSSSSSSRSSGSKTTVRKTSSAKSSAVGSTVRSTKRSVSTAIAMDDIQAKFLADLEADLGAQTTSYSVNNTIEDKEDFTQSEEVLWTRTFYLQHEVYNAGRSSASTSIVKSFANDVRASSKTTPAYIPTRTMYKERDPQGATESFAAPIQKYYIALEGLESNNFFGNRVNDYSLLVSTDYVPNDPFSFLAYYQKLGFYRGLMPDHSYLSDDYEADISEVNGLSISIKNFPIKNVYAYTGSDTKEAMSAAKSTSALQSSYAASDVMSRLYPTTWKPFYNTYGYQQKSLYAKAWDSQFTSGDAENLYKYTFAYINAVAKAAQKFAVHYKAKDDRFRDNSGHTISTSIEFFGNRTKSHDKVKDWVSGFDPRTEYTENSEVMGIKVNLSYDLRQIPFMYARAFASDGFFVKVDDDDFGHYFTDYAQSSWTQRVQRDGKIYYWKLPEVLTNQEYTRRFMARMKQPLVDWGKSTAADDWVKKQKLVFRLYRPNYYDRSDLYKGVMYIDTYSNETTNVFTDKFDCSKVKINSNNTNWMAR